MLYCKITKKYSHCQYQSLVFPGTSYGFFTLEFVYTFFIVTGFIWIISTYITLSLHWQQQASNQLIALDLARDCVERVWTEKGNIHKIPTIKKGVFTIELTSKKYPIFLPRFGKKNLELSSVEVVVFWSDDRGTTHEVRLQGYI